MTNTRRGFLRRSVLVGGSAFVAGCLDSGPSPESQVREAADAFDELRSIEKGLDEGYRNVARYVRVSDGGLGEVFVDATQPRDLGPDELDPERPQLLYSELTEDGRYEPAGVGWTVSTEKASEPPVLFDTEFDKATSGLIPGQSDHYGLNAWVFADHPDDVFDPFHPDLTGPSYVDELEATRAALDPFYSSDEAEDAGYEYSEKHIFHEDGLYGVPFVDPDAEWVDPERPPILLYRMTEQWQYELLGVEWFVPVAETDGPPELLDQQFHEPLAGHSSMTDQPEHYGLHAWLFRANPNGMFALFNPRFT